MIYTEPVRKMSVTFLALTLIVAACSREESGGTAIPIEGMDGPLFAGGESTSEAPAVVRTPEELLALIGQGSGDAAFELGAMYHDGEGLSRDYAKAKTYFERAAHAGDRRAMYNLGVMYLQGEGVKKDAIAARRWFTQATEAGNPRAPYQLGLLYYTGEGAVKDLVKAREYFTLAAVYGLPEAHHNLGIMLINGEGGAKDVVEGYAWLLVARTYGYQTAEDAIARLEPKLTDTMKSDGKALAEQISNEVESQKAMRAAGGE